MKRATLKMHRPPGVPLSKPGRHRYVPGEYRPLEQGTTTIWVRHMTPDEVDLHAVLFPEVIGGPPPRQDSPFGWILPRLEE